MRSEFEETATPMRPYGPLGSACSSSRFHVLPSSLERYNPLPEPPLDRNQGPRRASHKDAKRICELLGSKAISMPPVFSSLYKILCQVFPPSVVRKIPRSLFGPKGCPSAATNTMSAFFGSTMTLPIARESCSPVFFHV